MLTFEFNSQGELLEELQAMRVGHQSTLVRMARQSDIIHEFACSVADGLARRPRRLECRFLYDELGSRIFELICQQPEYYITRLEMSILSWAAWRIRELTGPVTLMELGSGNSTKTEALLRAYLNEDGKVSYIPVDVSEAALSQAIQGLSSQYPLVQVTGLACTYEEAFPIMAITRPTMLIFLGSSIGNLDEGEREAFLGQVAKHQRDGDFLLLGVDLIKDPAVIEAAYNDAAGITEAFTRNLFARMNRDLGAEVDVESIRHVASYSQERSRIEIRARCIKPLQINVMPLKKSFAIPAGEEIHTEVSCKFDLARLIPELMDRGFQTKLVFMDQQRWFALVLLQRKERA